MKTNKFVVLIIAGIIIISGCIEPYKPPILEQGEAFLVVEGNIYFDKDTNYLKLFYSQNLDYDGKAKVEQDATIYIEDNNQNKMFYSEIEPGHYILAEQNFQQSKQYKLYIQTESGKEYYSDAISFISTPDIDSVTWEYFADEGVQIYVNSHGDETTSPFYKWEFEEVWKFTSPHNPVLEIVGDTAIVTSLNTPNTCWKTKSSNDIIVGSSEKLNTNTISQQPVKLLEGYSDRLQMKYSILVKQYTISAQAYKYWTDIKDNTENLGTLFDLQPFQVLGNLHCADPSEAVIGYFDAYMPKEYRIYISRYELPTIFLKRFNDDYCPGDTLLYDVEGDHTAAILFFNKEGLVPYDYAYDLSAPVSDPPPIGYLISAPVCIDCSISGTPKKPEFWEGD